MKLKAGIYWGAGCGGCDVAVLDVHETILTVAEKMDRLTAQLLEQMEEGRRLDDAITSNLEELGYAG